MQPRCASIVQDRMHVMCNMIRLRRSGFVSLGAIEDSSSEKAHTIIRPQRRQKELIQNEISISWWTKNEI